MYIYMNTYIHMIYRDIMTQLYGSEVTIRVCMNRYTYFYIDIYIYIYVHIYAHIYIFEYIYTYDIQRHYDSAIWLRGYYTCVYE
jgi:hypothetical protein